MGETGDCDVDGEGAERVVEGVGGCEVGEGVSISTDDMEEMASAACCRAMAAGGGMVAGSAEGGMDPERGETEDDADDGGRRAVFVGDCGVFSLLDLVTCLECAPVSLRGIGGRGSRGDSGRRGDRILRPLWKLSASWLSVVERGSTEPSDPLALAPLTRGVCMEELMYISVEPLVAVPFIP